MESSRMVLPTRLQVKGWARVGPSGAHTLRRGAWYPVVRISSSNIVVLDVNRHNVPVDRRFLEIRYHPPERWTIVRCEPRVIDRKSTRLNSSHLVISYAVFCLKKKKKHT